MPGLSEKEIDIMKWLPQIALFCLFFILMSWIGFAQSGIITT